MQQSKTWVYVLILVPVAAYLVIMGFFVSYISKLARERSQLLAGRIKEEKHKAEEFAKLNQELENYAKQLFDKDFELMLANKRLQNLEQAKSKFVSVTTHQLRTPLSAIKWTFHMLLRESLGMITEEQRDFLQKGYDSTQRMIAIVNDLLNVASIEEGKFGYNFVLADFSGIIDEAIKEQTLLTQRKNIEINFQKPAELFKIKIDCQKIKLALGNLLENAINYSRTGGSVKITLKRRGPSSVEVAIKDKGIGIPKEHFLRLFSKFFRAKNAIQVHPDGSGLGLFISKNIIEKHGGKIRIESEEEKGTTVYFTLPLR